MSDREKKVVPSILKGEVGYWPLQRMSCHRCLTDITPHVIEICGGKYPFSPNFPFCISFVSMLFYYRYRRISLLFRINCLVCRCPVSILSDYIAVGSCTYFSVLYFVVHETICLFKNICPHACSLKQISLSQSVSCHCIYFFLE